MDYYGMSHALKSKNKIEKMVDNARKQGKSEQQIKQLVSVAVDEMLKRIKKSQKI